MSLRPNATPHVQATSEILSGNFTLAFRGEESTPLSGATATATDIEWALEGLSCVDDVIVSANGTTLNGGRQWRVTFNGPGVEGDVPDLVANSDGLVR